MWIAKRHIALLSFSVCCEGTLAEKRNFSDLECSVAVLYTMQRPWGRAFSE
jgi:hypothetical protein